MSSWGTPYQDAHLSVVGELTLLEREVELKRCTLPIEKWPADLDRIEWAAEHIKTPASFASESYTPVRRSDLAKAGGHVYLPRSCLRQRRRNSDDA